MTAQVVHGIDAAEQIHQLENELVAVTAQVVHSMDAAEHAIPFAYSFASSPSGGGQPDKEPEPEMQSSMPSLQSRQPLQQA